MQNSKHPDYENNIEDWTKQQDAYKGEESVKSKNTIYLPYISGMTDQEYKAYKKRALYFGATGRTVDSLTGAIFRKPPFVQNETNINTDNLGDSGQTLSEIGQSIAKNVIINGRCGVMVDTADEQPYITIHPAKNIINWRTIKHDGKEKLEMVMIHQVVNQEKKDDEYEVEKVDQYLELVLENNVYIQKLWQEEKGNFVLIKEIIPKKLGGKSFDYIPFEFVTEEGINTNINKSPINDLVNVNLSHYRSSADLEHGLHYTALPVAVVCGFQTDKELQIGSGVAWVSEDTASSAQYLEFSGAGLAAIVTAMETKEKQMAVLGSKLLEGKSSNQEAFATVALRQSGENSILSSISTSVSSVLNNALKTIAEWTGQSDKISVELNNDFVTARLTPQDLGSLLQALQSKSISFDSYFYNMQKGEMYPENWTIEQEQDLIESTGL